MTYNLNDSVGFIINRTSLKLKHQLNTYFKPYDVTTEQWGILNCLWEKDGISQKELADRLDKDQPTITRILDKLEGKELISRQANPLDRREFLIHVTDKGMALQDVLVPLATKSLQEALKGITPEEASFLKDLLNKIFANLTL